MGFLKRLLSIGSKKNKKKTPAHEGDSNQLRRHHTQTLPLVSEDAEVAASRLLRSASARFAIVSEPDYNPLPPLPHPVNSLTAIPSVVSTRTSTIQSRGTYIVKVHERTIHSCTEFPNANPSLETPRRKGSSIPMPEDDSDDDDLAIHHDVKYPPITPRDQNRLLRLRQDPSVASLLNMYDEHGRLGSDVFSNTPSPSGEGRPQRRRTGSTLRQLMGDSSPDANLDESSNEGDISWADRFLEDRNFDCTSIASATSSSFGTRTPDDLPYTYDHSNDNSNTTRDATKHVTFLSENHSSLNSSNCPAISSLEVELSGNTTSVAEIHPSVVNYPRNLETSQKASEIFHFLMEKRRPKEDKSLPALPASVSLDGLALGESLPLLPEMEETPVNLDSDIRESQEQDFASRIPRLRHERPPSRTTTENEVVSLVTATTTRIPRARGPRDPKSSTIPMAALEPDAPHHINAENHDTLTFIPSRAHHRKSSFVEANMAFIMSPGQERRHVASEMNEIRYFKTSGTRPKPASIMHDKENSWSTCGVPPITPIRSRSVFLDKENIDPVSPASSSEMSPVGQQLMAKARTQRHRL